MRHFGFLPRLRIVGMTEHSIIDERILLQYIPQQIELATISRKENQVMFSGIHSRLLNHQVTGGCKPMKSL
jgi:hypothetical protein